MASNAGPYEAKTATPSSVVTDTIDEAMVIIPKTLQSTPDSAAPSPASGRNSTRETIRDHPAWIAYSIVRSRYMVPQINKPITPTETVGFSNRLAS